MSEREKPGPDPFSDSVPTSLETRPLPVLRAMLDAIDRDILQLLSRRMGIVGEVAAYKREHGMKIRDLERERLVLRERGQRAEKLGLPGGVVESIYRMLLVASRDYQASLRAGLPQHIEPRTVAVIGGKGGMGAVMARMFGDLGHAVLITDVDTPLTNEEAASVSDVVIVSVPIHLTERVIAEVGPHLKPGAILADVTSVKEGPVTAMLSATSASQGNVVGTHPMFGPGVHSLIGQRVVMTRGRGDEAFDWLRSMFEARGLVVTESTPEEHDRVMAVVQVLNHFQKQVLGLAMARSGVPLERSLAFTSPAYLLESYVTARHFAQSSDLYGSIEMLNPRRQEVTDTFTGAAAEIAEVLASRDREKFAGVFDEVRAFFGDFTEEALEQSSFLLDRLIELTAGRSANRGAETSESERGEVGPSGE